MPPTDSENAGGPDTELQRIDLEILGLLQKRIAHCRSLAEALDASGQGPAEPTAIPRVLQAVQNAAVVATHPAPGSASGRTGAQSNVDFRPVFTEIAAICRESVRPLLVGYLGPEGTFTQAATFKHFGNSTQTRPYTGIDDVFRAVETGECTVGVVPVENSIEGTINRTLDRISDSPLGICGEVTLRIEHNLLTHAQSMQDVEVVYAHPQALAQCRMWLDANLPHAKRVAASSNAAGAELAVEDNTAAAIASVTAAGIYSLKVLASNIEDNISNTTRFIVIGAFEPEASNNDVTSLVVSAPHRPGGLRKMLEPFEKAGVSMSRIESRPSRNELWSYVFFIDVSGHRDEPVLAQALQELSAETRYMRILGSYPTAGI